MEGLNRGLPRLGIGKSSKVNRLRAEQDNKSCLCRTSQANGCVGETCHRTESDCDNTDRKCLCNGIVNKDHSVDLKSTRELLKQMEL